MKCNSCGDENEGCFEQHTCPFKEDIHDDSETLCNCCEECMEQCRQDI